MHRRSNAEKEVRDEGERRSWNEGGLSRPEGSRMGYDNAAEHRGYLGLDIHVVFGWDHQDPKSLLEDTNDALNNVAELCIT